MTIKEMEPVRRSALRRPLQSTRVRYPTRDKVAVQRQESSSSRELQQQTTVEIEPQSALVRFIHRVPIATPFNPLQATES